MRVSCTYVIEAQGASEAPPRGKGAQHVRATCYKGHCIGLVGEPGRWAAAIACLLPYLQRRLSPGFEDRVLSLVTKS